MDRIVREIESESAVLYILWEQKKLYLYLLLHQESRDCSRKNDLNIMKSRPIKIQ